MLLSKMFIKQVSSNISLNGISISLFTNKGNLNGDNLFIFKIIKDNKEVTFVKEEERENGEILLTMPEV